MNELVCRVFLVLVGTAISLPRSFASENARLEILVVDESGTAAPARAWVEVGGMQFFRPSAPETATVYAKDQSFSCDGKFTITVPAGDAVIHVEKGKEFVPFDLAIQVEDLQTLEQTIVIKRWIDMPAEGWYSADLHVHLGQDNPRILRQLALADDVHLVPAFTYWLRGRGEQWKANWPVGMLEGPTIIDKHHIVTRNNIEIERINRDAVPGATIGATFLFNLNRPVTAIQYGEHFPTDATLCRIVKIHSPEAVFDSDKPSWAETVVGAALGTLDTVQVCHNHYYRNSTGLGGYGMIGPLAIGESNFAAGDGLFHRTNHLYYRFLNCGFRLGVSGGSAIGVKAMPTGHHRVYAEIEGALTAKKMWDAIREGRSFATTGPMISLTANGKGIGSTIETSSMEAESVKLSTRVRSLHSLEALQIVHNGRVIATRKLVGAKANPVDGDELSFDVVPRRSGWVAARALFRSPDGLLRQAHTSPIYLSVDEKPIAFSEDARYMIRWIDVLEEVAESDPKRFPTNASQQQVLSMYSEARLVYENVIVNAKRYWETGSRRETE